VTVSGIVVSGGVASEAEELLAAGRDGDRYAVLGTKTTDACQNDPQLIRLERQAKQVFVGKAEIRCRCRRC
jgi:hypothetical protein